MSGDQPARWSRGSRRAVLLVAAGLVLAAGLALAVWSTIARPASERYRTIESPDGHYSIVVFRIVTSQAAFPGQAGDAPGFVRLYDRSGRILQEKPIDMVQKIDQVSWDPHEVHIKLFADWTLPN